MKSHFLLYLKLIRFDRPIGWILLAWPCLWGIAIAYQITHTSLLLCIQWSIILTVGAFLMRSFGCIINDLVDCKIDEKVTRTKDRPLASGAMTQRQSLFAGFLTLIPAALIFLQLPSAAKVYATIGAVLLFIYPFMKRITYYPQFVLGLAFNIGVPVAYVCVTRVSAVTVPHCSVVYLYLCGVFWTMAYDTLYAFQDVADDQITGVKSTAIKFNHYPKVFVSFCYLLAGFFLLLSKEQIDLGAILFTGFATYTLWHWNPVDVESCGKLFRLHAIFGLFGIV